MESIIESISRVGNFTSSEIGKLMTYGRNGKDFGAPALTYIEEKKIERELGRSLNSENSARSSSWGTFVEQYVFSEILGTQYKLVSKTTVQHPTINCWLGSPDLVSESESVVADIKSPFTLKSFYQLVKGNTIEYLRENHKEGDTYYWQLVSNSILTNSKHAELIVFCPFKSELKQIREFADNYDGNQNKISWINWAEDYELPFIPDDCQIFKNLNTIRFEVGEEDKEKLTNRVLEAQKLLEDLVS